MCRAAQHLIMVAVLVGLSIPCAAEPVTIDYQLPEPGTHFVSDDLLLVDLTANTISNGKVTGTTSSLMVTHEVREMIVIETNDVGLTKVRISYLESSEGMFQDGKEQSADTAVAGKSYVVEVEDDGVSVIDINGMKVTGKDKDKVQKDCQRLGQKDNFSELFDGRRVHSQEPIDIPREIISDLWTDEGSEIGDAKGTLTYFGTTKRGPATAAIFLVTMDFQLIYGEMILSMDLSGKLLMDVEKGWPLELILAGPISMSGKKRGVELSGEGRMMMHGEMSIVE